jgi:AAA15 family ATPase/GTPase
MENFINHISISNFKSIRNLKLKGLSRINLFIGKPNVGKSNILEALGVFSLPYLELNSNKKLSSFIRVENQNELFFNGNFENQILLSSNIGKYSITKNPDYINPISGSTEKADSNILDLNLNNLESESHLYFDSNLGLSLTGISPFKKLPREKRTARWINVRYYNFIKSVKTKEAHLNYLVPPSGTNLMQIVENISELKKEITNLYGEYNLS